MLEAQSPRFDRGGSSELNRIMSMGDSGVIVVMSTLTVTSAKTSCRNCNLNLALLWRPEGAVLEAEVLGAVQDGGVLGTECDGRHVG